MNTKATITIEDAREICAEVMPWVSFNEAALQRRVNEAIETAGVDDPRDLLRFYAEQDAGIAEADSNEAAAFEDAAYGAAY